MPGYESGSGVGGRRDEDDRHYSGAAREVPSAGEVEWTETKGPWADYFDSHGPVRVGLPIIYIYLQNSSGPSCPVTLCTTST